MGGVNSGGRLQVQRIGIDPNPGNKGASLTMSDNEVLVVASKVKGYIKTKGDMKTSAAVLEELSNRIRSMCDQAIENARNDGRKTVLDRDFMG